MELSDGKPRFNKRYLLLMLVLVLGIYVLVPQFGDFKSSWQVLKRPDWGWVLVAMAATALTYLAAATTYCLLAFTRLRYGLTALVQLAAVFINRLLPGGVGALGMNFLYLKRHKHTAAQAGSIVAINNLLGFVGHWLIVAVAILLYADDITALSRGHSSTAGDAAKLAGIGLIAALLVLIVFGRRRFQKGIQDAWQQLLSYRRQPERLVAALGSSMVLTLANVGALAACAAALGIDLPLAAILLIFTFGITAGTATPTPGGLGGFEAGLVAGFVAYHVPSAAALAAALLFRLITYWLALAVGALAFVYVQRRGLLGG